MNESAFRARATREFLSLHRHCTQHHKGLRCKAIFYTAIDARSVVLTSIGLKTRQLVHTHILSVKQLGSLRGLHTIKHV